MDKELIEQCNQYGFEIFSERRVQIMYHNIGRD